MIEFKHWMAYLACFVVEAAKENIQLELGKNLIYANTVENEFFDETRNEILILGPPGNRPILGSLRIGKCGRANVCQNLQHNLGNLIIIATLPQKWQ